MLNYTNTTAQHDAHVHDDGSHGSSGRKNRMVNKRQCEDNDGGYHVWSGVQGDGGGHFETYTPDVLFNHDAKRIKTIHEKHLHWKERLTAAEGQQTVLLAELSMAEYHLHELQVVVGAAALRVEEKKAVLEECRTHVARMSEAVGVLSALGQEEDGTGRVAPE